MEKSLFLILIVFVSLSIWVIGAAIWPNLRKMQSPESPFIDVQTQVSRSSTELANEAGSSTNKRSPRTDRIPGSLTWQTYEDKKYGFKLSYPGGFELEQYEDTCDTVSAKRLDIQDPLFCYGVDILDPQLNILYFGLSIGKTRLSLGEYANKQKKQAQDSMIVSPVTVVRQSLNGIDGFESFGAGSEANTFGDDFNFKKDDLLFVLSLDPVAEGRISASEYPNGCFDKNDLGCLRSALHDYDPDKNLEIYRGILSGFWVVLDASQTR